ncbi:MAG: DUF4179 domain-containing protein [Paenibacillus macerans]|nr:DUF4179 domain-containing protein [Paenibacillus macerans]MBS5914453.1 DUF4179 domain-containing protein [Paenibacillus macerans]MCY7562533.1 DUF4179 domain-containing protein [Paenibacillus macerans]MDU7476697.1 DUF4179 domain-containing protein [Paenibacillus macerans]MEC0141223.1 DUF4179 domain-containing protein [Paenibacillus macerans]MEC0155166.1 DUF4179 domain-containing protein [Paenibacillus macerans]
MANHEDWIMEKSWQEVRQAAGRVTDEKLDEALRQGIERAARERMRPLSRLRTMKRLRVAAAVLSILLVIGAGAVGSYKLNRIYRVPAAEKAPINARIPSYVENIFDANSQLDNPSLLNMLKQAADHGLYHELNQSIVAKGYKMTVDGIVADSRRIIMFYTTENQNEDLPLRLSYNQPPQLLDRQGRPLNGSFTWDTYAQLPKNQPLTKGVMVFDFETAGQIPESFQIKTTWSQFQRQGSNERQSSNVSVERTENLVVPVTIQNGAHAADIEERPIHVEITQSGQQITFTKLIQSPLRTDLVFDFKSSTGQKLEKIEAVLELASLKKQAKERMDFDTTLRYDRTLLTPEGGTIYLTSSFYSEHRELWLKFYYASFQPDHEVQITVDPEEGKLVHSPDSQISLERIPEESTDEELRLRLQYGPQKEVKGGYFELKDTFADADGERHPFTQQYDAGEGTFLSIPNYRQYPGPFSFDIIRYWGNVLELNEVDEQRIR